MLEIHQLKILTICSINYWQISICEFSLKKKIVYNVGSFFSLSIFSFRLVFASYSAISILNIPQWYSEYNIHVHCTTEAAKKSYFFNGSWPLRHYPPPPLELNGSRNFFNKLKQKIILSLMVSPLPLFPPPLITAIKEITFILASLTKRRKKIRANICMLKENV